MSLFEVLVTAVDVKCNLCKSGENATVIIVTKLLEGDWKLDISKGFFLQLSIRPGLKFWELVNNMKIKPSTIF